MSSGLAALLTWQSAIGIAIACGLMLPFIIYVDWRKKGRTLTQAQYWNAWWSTGAVLLSAHLGTRLVYFDGIPGLLAIVGGYALGMTVTFWYALLLEHCLGILGAIAPSQ